MKSTGSQHWIQLPNTTRTDRRGRPLKAFLQAGVALLTLHFVIPGDFHEHVDEPELHPAAFATAVMLLAVGGVTAAALS